MLENAILFVGLGTNKYKLDEIVETNDLSYVADNYGEDSCFYEACNTALTFGADKLFFLNLDTWENIQNHQELLRDFQFDYVVPLDLYLDETYYDGYYGKVLAYSQLFLLVLHNTISTLIMTGKYASDFEDLTQFLDNENKAIEYITPVISNLTKENIIYVANNLYSYKYANAVLASMLATTDYAEYPESSNLGEAIFDIDFCDITNNLVFFKNNYLTGTTVENLINFNTDNTLRIVLVNKILHYFQFHRPDNEKYIGTAYTEYKKIAIAQILQDYLTDLVDWIITDYQIESVTDVSTELGTVDIILQYAIWPKFTTERYLIETKA